MKINEACRTVELNDNNLKAAYNLSRLYSITGDSSKSGYLDDSITGVSLDEFGNFVFESHKEKDGRIIDSIGVVLDESLLMKQHEKESNRNHYRVYSWNIDNESYTYLAFDGRKDMDDCFDKLRINSINLEKEDVSSIFSKLNISTDTIGDIKVGQGVSALNSMFNDSIEEFGTSSFVRR